MTRFYEQPPTPMPAQKAADDPAAMMAAQAYLHTQQAGAWTPLLQSIITGVLLGFAVMVLGIKFRWQDTWLYALLTFALATAAFWLMRQNHLTILTRLERMTGQDLDGNGVVGSVGRDGEKPVTKVEIRDYTAGNVNIKYSSLPLDEARLSQLAAGLLSGRPFSERTWAGKSLLMSSNEYRALRTEMIKRGLLKAANSKDPRQGFVLTRAGYELMKRFYEKSDTIDAEVVE